MTLTETLDAAASGLPGVERRETDQSVEWSVAGRPFAVAAGSAAEFRLRPEIAGAALATSDVSPSPRGREWVVFAPPELDRFALDRATAWFQSAQRYAPEGARGPAATRSPRPTPPHRP